MPSWKLAGKLSRKALTGALKDPMTKCWAPIPLPIKLSSCLRWSLGPPLDPILCFDHQNWASCGLLTMVNLAGSPRQMICHWICFCKQTPLRSLRCGVVCLMAATWAWKFNGGVDPTSKPLKKKRGVNTQRHTYAKCQTIAWRWWLIEQGALQACGR